MSTAHVNDIRGGAAAITPPGARELIGATGDARATRVGTMRRLKNLSMFCRQLHVLISTGTPLTEALACLERQCSEAAWRQVVADLRLRIEEGASLHQAMAASPEYFDVITRSLVAAGETAGKLPAMLDRAATLSRKELAVRRSIIGAMVYPGLLVTVAMTVLIVLLMFVLPRFAELFSTLDMPMPPTTQALMLLSDFLLGYWWAVLIGLIGGGVALRLWLGTPAGVLFIDTLVLRVPQFGRITQNFATARIIRLMGILLDSYLPLLEVIGLVRESTTNSHYRRLMENAESAVTRGEPMSSAFADASLISPSVYEAMRSGEHSGQIGSLLLNIAGFLDEENEVVIKSLASIVEPLILIVLGALVGFVALSMFMPLFDLTAMTSGGG